MTDLKFQNYASGAEVRTWALENGFTVGERGKLSPAITKAYNKTHSVKYVAGKFTKTTEVTGRKNGKKVTRKVNVTQARTVLNSNGIEVGKRGRVSKNLLAIALGLEPIVVVNENAIKRQALRDAGINVGSRGRISQKALANL